MKFVMKERQAMDIQAPPAQRQRIYGGPSGRLPASLRRAGGCERLNLNSGEFRMHDVTASEARNVCDRITAANKEREGKRDPKNCMAGWEPTDGEIVDL